MINIRITLLALLSLGGILGAQSSSSSVLRVGIVGLAHGHVSGFLNGGGLTPAGGALKRTDVQIVGIVDPDRHLFDTYATRYHLSPSLYFASVDEMISNAHPQAALVFTSTFGHTKAVEECARRGVHVMMEKPLSVTYKDALAMADAARRGNVHVLVDYETSWYASNLAARNLVAQGALGDIRKVVVRDGHKGPKLIGVQPEFFAWLTDPKLDGGGALYDFGCYGADLMTWLMKGEVPLSVTAVTSQLQPEAYPNVDDEAEIVVKYRTAIAIFQGSWNWPFDIKNMDVYGRTGYVKTIRNQEIEVRRAGETEGQVSKAAPVPAPFDDPLHLLAAVIRGEVSEEGTLSGLGTNVIVSEILDAARQSAQTGRTVTLPLE
jgi:glucose-fructose oxidoreductase